ncbi:hypothetical protein JZ751_026954 [Albula glossodonta]|uniref:Uncharacterized protein n=1 Tax=Albula glossodonta TaxID=121402 RepID=A0A8T2NKN3_9TELE|nr:hypothetical protein JZ751_026954 [Albula glossodonta]
MLCLTAPGPEGGDNMRVRRGRSAISGGGSARGPLPPANHRKPLSINHQNLTTFWDGETKKALHCSHIAPGQGREGQRGRGSRGDDRIRDDRDSIFKPVYTKLQCHGTDLNSQPLCSMFLISNPHPAIIIILSHHTYY